MLAAPLHPAVVHLAIGVGVVMPVLVLVLALAIGKGWLPRRAWWLGVLLQAIVTGGAWVATKTGEEDEERVERVVAEAAIHKHEDLGETTAYAATALLLLLVASGTVPARWWRLGAIASGAGTIAVAVLLLQTGRLGGELVYDHGAARAWNGSR